MNIKNNLCHKNKKKFFMAQQCEGILNIKLIFPNSPDFHAVIFLV